MHETHTFPKEASQYFLQEEQLTSMKKGTNQFNICKGTYMPLRIHNTYTIN